MKLKSLGFALLAVCVCAVCCMCGSDSETPDYEFPNGPDSDSDPKLGDYPVELADKLIELGAVDAVNLDGGGSSAMVGSDGKVLNRPSDTGSAEVIVERKISTAVVISEVN